MSLPEVDLAALPPLPSVKEGEPVFEQPWHAQVFAMTAALNERGHFDWKDWASAFGAKLGRTPQRRNQTPASHYFGCWLDALEGFLSECGLADAEQLADLQRRWDATARATPHGEPIALATTGLFVYGTLAPGKENHSIIAGIRGEWVAATLLGRLFGEGWGAASGCPGMVPDESGEPVAGWALLSAELPAHWAMLDDFEGEGYRRVAVTVEAEDGRRLQVSVYALNRD